nr:hypothetical protein K-LCC10_0050 [Kaumoebavirus]
MDSFRENYSQRFISKLTSILPDVKFINRRSVPRNSTYPGYHWDVEVSGKIRGIFSFTACNDMYFAKYTSPDSRLDINTARYEQKDDEVFPYKTAIEFMQVYPHLFINLIKERDEMRNGLDRIMEAVKFEFFYLQNHNVYFRITPYSPR